MRAAFPPHVEMSVVGPHPHGETPSSVGAGVEVPLGPVAPLPPRPRAGVLRWFEGRRVAVTGCLVGVAMALGAVLHRGADLVDFGDDVCRLQTERVERAGRAPLGQEARALAEEALAPKVDPSHPLVQHRMEILTRLERLGLVVASRDHLHISDVDLEHGGAVIRSALGLVPLVGTVSSTLSVSDVPEPFARAHLRPEQYVRLAPIYLERLGSSIPEDVELEMEDLVDRAMVELEADILEKMLRIAQVRLERDRLPPEARIFVNMSFGTSADRLATAIAMEAMSAPEGSPLYELARRTLGEAPIPPPPDPEGEGPTCGARSNLSRPSTPRDPSHLEEDAEAFGRQLDALKRELVYPMLRERLGSPAMRRIVDTAKRDLAAEVARARKAGVIVFSAAGNEYLSAASAGDPAMSEPSDAHVKGILLIGAANTANPHDPRDDRVAEFSAVANVAFVTTGTELPVWLEGRVLVGADGTSFSSPLAIGDAVAVASQLPNAPVDRVAAVVLDRRVHRDIPHTDRDGAGVMDPFAAILLANNPKLTKARIDDAWRDLGDPNADVGAVRRSLGLQPIVHP